MISEFEDFTKILNTYEKDSLLPRVAEILSKCVGKKNAIRNKEICARLKAEGYDPARISEPRMRKIINIIRRRGDLVPLLIANSRGYFVATSKEEVETYLESLLERGTAIFDIRTKLSNQLNGRLFL